MAFETISGAGQFYLGNLKKGEKYVGYLKGVKGIPNQWGGKSWILVCVNPSSGIDVDVLCGGAAKYAAISLAKSLGIEPLDGKEDEKVKAEMVLMKQCVGYLIEITSTGEYISKKSKKTIKTFSFGRDPKKLLLDAKFDAEAVSQVAAEKATAAKLDELPF